MQWLTQCEHENIPISGQLIKDKDKTFANKLCMKGFGASDGWLTNIIKRNKIGFKKMCGEAASVAEQVCLD